MEFSIRLKELREARGLSQADLAEIIGVGVSTVGMWESTRRMPGAKSLDRLITFFNCPLDYLLGKSDERAFVGKSEFLTEEERTLLLLYRQLRPDLQKLLLSTAETWASAPSEMNKKSKESL